MALYYQQRRRRDGRPHKPGPRPQTQRPAARVSKRYGADRIGIVGFNNKGFVIARPAHPHAPWLYERSQMLHTKVGGMTNMACGLRQALELLRWAPEGVLRRIWLLSDGQPSDREDTIMAAVAEACRLRVNINTIGFGDEYNAELLHRISATTHHGEFVHAETLRHLAGLLQRSRPNQERHRAETTILTIDLSESMGWPMEGKPRVRVVEEAIAHLLHYKQKLYA